MVAADIRALVERGDTPMELDDLYCLVYIPTSRDTTELML
jgi:hypothetical protein